MNAPASPAAQRDGPRATWRVKAALLGFSLAVQLVTFGNRWGSPDERERMSVAESVLDRGTLRMPSGKHTMYPPLTPVLMAGGIILKRVMPGHDDGWLLVPPLLASTASVLPFHHALLAAGTGGPAAAGAAVLFALANPTWPYGKRLYSEPFTALFVLCALAAALTYRRSASRKALVATWMCMLLVAGNNSVALVLVPVLLGLTALRNPDDKRRVDLAAALAGLGSGAVLAALWMTVNALKFGSPFTSGYAEHTVANDVFDGRNGFSTPLYVGLHGLLFSAGRGLVVFNPLALVGLGFLLRRTRSLRGAAPWLVAAGALPLLVVSAWWSWHGGTCFGPRLITPFMGAWLLGLGPALDGALSALSRVAITSATALTLLANVAGTLFTFGHDQQFWLREQPFNDYLDVYTPQYSQVPRFLRNAWCFPDETTWLWLSHGPRPPSRVELPAPSNVAELRVAQPAPRHAWEITELEGEDTDGNRVRPVNVEASMSAADAMLDGNPATAWVLPRQQKGDGFRATFGVPVRALVLTHAREGKAYVRFPEWVVQGRRVETTIPHGPVGIRWPLPLALLAAGWCLWSVRRHASAFVAGRAAPVETGPHADGNQG